MSEDEYIDPTLSTPLFPSTPLPTCHPPEPLTNHGSGGRSGSPRVWRGAGGLAHQDRLDHRYEPHLARPARLQVEHGPKRRAMPEGTRREREEGDDARRRRHRSRSSHSSSQPDDDEDADSERAGHGDSSVRARARGVGATGASPSRASSHSSEPQPLPPPPRPAAQTGRGGGSGSGLDASKTSARRDANPCTENGTSTEGGRPSRSTPAHAAHSHETEEAPASRDFRASSVASAASPAPVPRSHTAARQRQQREWQQWEAQTAAAAATAASATPARPLTQAQTRPPHPPAHQTHDDAADEWSDDDAAADEVEALSSQLQQDMQLLSQLKSERDGMAARFQTLMDQIRPQLQGQGSDGDAPARQAADAADDAPALELQHQFEEQMHVYDARIAQLEEAITGAAKRMAVEHQQQHAHAHATRRPQPQPRQQPHPRPPHAPSSVPRQHHQHHQHLHVSFAQDTPPPASSARPSRRDASASSRSRRSPQQQQQQQQQPSRASHLPPMEARPAPPAQLQLPDLPPLSFPPASSLFEEARSFEQSLPPALHHSWAQTQRSLLACVANRDTVVAHEVERRERRVREAMGEQFEAALDQHDQWARQQTDSMRASAAAAAAALETHVHALQTELQRTRAELLESEGHRRDIAALYERASTHAQYAEPALAETQHAAAHLAAENEFLRNQLGLAQQQIEHMHAELQQQQQQQQQPLQQVQPHPPPSSAPAPSADTLPPQSSERGDARLASLATQLARSEREVHHWRQEFERASAATESHSARASASAEDASKLRAQLEQSQARWDAERTVLQGRVSAESHAASALVARISEANEAAQRAHSELESERSARVNALDTAADRDSLVRTQHERLQHLQAQLHQLDTRMRDQTDQHAAQLAERDAALAAAVAAAAAPRQGQLSAPAHSDDSEQLRTTQSALSAALESLRVRDEQLRRAKSKLTATRAARRGFEEQIASMESQLRQSQIEVSRLGAARLEDQRHAHARIDAIERKLLSAATLDKQSRREKALRTERERDGRMSDTVTAAAAATAAAASPPPLPPSSGTKADPPAMGAGAPFSAPSGSPPSGPRADVREGAGSVLVAASRSATADADLLHQLHELKQLRHVFAGRGWNAEARTPSAPQPPAADEKQPHATLATPGAPIVPRPASSSAAAPASSSSPSAGAAPLDWGCSPSAAHMRAVQPHPLAHPPPSTHSHVHASEAHLHGHTQLIITHTGALPTHVQTTIAVPLQHAHD